MSLILQGILAKPAPGVVQYRCWVGIVPAWGKLIYSNALPVAAGRAFFIYS